MRSLLGAIVSPIRCGRPAPAGVVSGPERNGVRRDEASAESAAALALAAEAITSATATANSALPQ